MGSLSVDIYKGRAGTTGEDGCTEFKEVPYGKYEVDETLKVGWRNLRGLEGVVVDEPKEKFVIVNQMEGGDLKVCKFDDRNANGIRDDGERYMAWKVSVEGQRPADRGDDGCYTWRDLPVGSYKVYEADRPGWTHTTENNGDMVKVKSHETTRVEFGNFELGTIEGRKYEDVNETSQRS